MILEPGLVALDGERPDEPQAALGIREDTHHISAPPDLLVEPLEHVGRLHVLPVRQRQAEVGESLVDVLLHPAGELGVFAALFGEPGSQIAPHLREVAPVVHPAQLEQAIVVDLARHIVERLRRKCT